MKFICQSSLLRAEIELANSFSSSKNSLSISSNVLLEASNDALTVKATDQKMGFSSTIDVSVLVPGATTVYCEKLSQLLKNVPDIDIEVAEENGNLTIKPADGSNAFIINIKTIEASKFPELAEIDESLYFSLTQRDYFDMIDKTSFAVADEDSRHFLTGVYMERKNDDLVLVATDGKRLAMVKRKFEQDIPSFIPAIIPVQFLSSIMTIGSGDGVLSLGFKGNFVFANIEGRMIYATLITGNYPNYEKVIPSSFKNSCKIRTNDLISAMNLNSVLIESKSRRIFFDINQDGIMLSVEDSDGNSRNIVKCDYEGEEIKLIFNFNYLFDSIKKIDTEFLSLNINTTSSAIGIKSEPESDYIFIIMPIQV